MKSSMQFFHHRHLAQQISSHKPFCKNPRGGFTLIEVLIATTMTLIMLSALALGFKQLSDSLSEGRARLTLNDRLRGVSEIIKRDLENMTVDPAPRPSTFAGLGYFEYYDGPLSDFTLAQRDEAASRFGDVDDLMAFTVRASGDWFTGKVPLAIVKAKEIEQGATGVTIDPVDWVTDTVISSEYAEIVYFMAPAGIQDATPDNRVVSDIEVESIPLSYNLYRRVLLIRPDLNVASVVASGANNHFQLTGRPALFADPDSAVNQAAQLTSDLPSVPEIVMARAFQNADLSMRASPVPVPTGGGVRYAIANSLEDLARRESRFGHAVSPSPVGPSNSTTMPLLAITDPGGLYGTGQTVDQLTARVYHFPDDIVPAGGPHNTGPNGFLRREYILNGDRRGEDILLSSILAFDIKAFDPTVFLLNHPGNDGVPSLGTPGAFGAYGSDDLVLSPSDPGYQDALRNIDIAFTANSPFANNIIAGQGAYVDLAWANRLAGRIGGTAGTRSLFTSDFAGASSVRTRNLTPEEFFKSGQVITDDQMRLIVFQPTYDTSTTTYEIDGHLQYEDPANWRGTIWLNGRSQSVFNIAPLSDDPAPIAIDRGADGLDSDGDGRADNDAERETATCFPVPLEALQVKLRIEDSGTNEIQQISIVQGFEN